MTNYHLWDAKNPHVPVDSHGNMKDWYGHYGANNTQQWEPFPPRTLTLTLDSYSRGQSSAKYWWKDDQGRRYPMFLKDLLDLIQNETLINGQVTATFTAVKRGQNYGIKRV